MQHPKFSRSFHQNFVQELRTRVRKHFKDNDISIHANRSMKLKTVFMLSLFSIPLIILSSGIISSTSLLFILYIISGFGMAGIGMGVMHDAIHGSYSRKNKLNKILGETINLIGANATVWRLQHNILHHTYTNIQGADDDINAPFFLRFSPHVKKYKIHQFQYIYIWFFYSISTIAWITLKDVVRLFRYRDMRLINSKKEFISHLIKLIMWKIMYYLYALILPAIFLPFSFGTIFFAFISMHVVTGLIISCVFQVAHIMPEIKYPQPNKKNEIENSWLVHQLLTTSNFSPKNKSFSWFIGGLNYQIEHHLFPNICHVHYRHISPIIKDTAEEFGIPYNEKSTFTRAIYDHMKMLKSLGT